MALKISTKSLAKLKELISPLDTREMRLKYAMGDFLRADRVKDIDKRYRWDLLWASVPNRFVADLHRFERLNTLHIDSALRSIVAPLKKGVAPKAAPSVST